MQDMRQSILQIAGGKIMTLANGEMDKIITNLLDSDTPPEKPRQLNIRLEFRTDLDREQVKITGSVSSKLIPKMAVSAQMSMDTDNVQVDDNGEVFENLVLEEITPRPVGQIDINGREQARGITIVLPKK